VSLKSDQDDESLGATSAPADRRQITPLQRAGAVLWPSFFAASVATMVFFAFVDPTELGLITFPQIDIAREWGYTIGFFMFWGCTFSSSLFTQILLRPPAEVDGR
jgi:hypothetical protein